MLTEADMNASLKNLVRLHLRLGEMDPPEADPYAKIGRQSHGDIPPWDRASSRELVRQTTDESIVLLKN